MRLGVQRRGKVEHALGGIRTAVEHDVLDISEELLVNLLVDVLLDLSRVHDAHVHASLAGVVQERRVERAAHGLVAAEGEREVRHAARDLASRAQPLDLAGGVDEINSVVVVLLHASANGENVGIEDDVLGVEAHLLHQKLVRTAADAHLLGLGCGLALLVEGHHHNRGAVALDNLRLVEELLLATLEGDRVHDALALAALQASLHDVELGRVNHEGHLGNIGLGHHQVDKLGHSGLTVDEAVIHVDINDVGAVLHLLEGDRQRLLVVAVDDGLLEDGGASHVAALTKVDERLAVVLLVRFVVQRLKAGEAHDVRDIVLLAGLVSRHHVRQALDVLVGGAAAATDSIDKSLLGEDTAVLSHLSTLLVVATHGIGQTGVGVAEHPAVSDTGQVLDVRDHVLGTERAVQTDRDGLGVAHGVPERLVGLAGQGAAGVVDNGAGHKHRDLLAPLLEVHVDGKHRSLRVEGVEDGLHEQHVDATVNQSLNLLVVRLHDLVVGATAERRVLHRGRHRQGLVGGADRTRREAGLGGVLLRELHAALLRELGSGLVEQVHLLLLVELVVSLRDHGRVEGVRLDDVRARREVRGVDLLDHVGARDHEHVVVALEVVRVVLVPLAAEVILAELVLLHGGAHGAVNHHDALLHDLVDLVEGGGGLDGVDPLGVLGHGGCSRETRGGGLGQRVAAYKIDRIERNCGWGRPSGIETPPGDDGGKNAISGRKTHEG